MVSWRCSLTMTMRLGRWQEIEITPEFEFLVLACDGLWDTITSKEAVRHVSERLREGYTAQVRHLSVGRLSVEPSREQPWYSLGPTRCCSCVVQQASHSLANLAIRSGSSDNVSVVVVLLNAFPKNA